MSASENIFNSIQVHLSKEACMNVIEMRRASMSLLQGRRFKWNYSGDFLSAALFFLQARPVEQPNSLSRMAHIFERVGLATAGAQGGLFVAACMIRADSGALDSIGFVAAMCLTGMVGFYLGIDIPRATGHAIQCRGKAFEREVNPAELLSACGTFLAAMAALVSVYVIIFDETPELTVTVVVGCGWLFGATMLIAAGALARLRTIGRSVA
jgi:hypothetical protein